jgi:hypothetical protein
MFIVSIIYFLFLSNTIRMNKCIDSKGVHKVCEKDKICNPKSGRCIKDRTLNKANTTIVDIPRTKKTIRDFVKDIKKYNTARDLIEGYKDDKDATNVIKVINKDFLEIENTKSIQGFIYERLWDICIKLGITDFTDKDTKHGVGNINNKKDATFENIKDYFDTYMTDGVISGNSGGYSDITFENNKTLHLVSVKYIKGTDIKKFDIQNLCTIIKDRENDEYDDIKTLLFVKDKGKFKTLCANANKSSNILIKYISPNGNYENVYDLGDLEVYFHKLKKLLELYDYCDDDEYIELFKNEYLEIKYNKKPFIPRFHQQLFIEKINMLMTKGNKKILVGAIPRSGKTYIMAGAVLRHVKEHYKQGLTTYNNYVIITPAPNETLQQYKDAFYKYIDFDRYNIKADIITEHHNDLKFNRNNERHFVYLISKQRLGNIKGNKGNIDDIENNVYKENIEKYFGEKNNNNIKIIFMDEAHFGMSSEIAQDIVKSINGNNSVKIFVTATYNKPQKIYGVDKKNVIKWDLDDIKIIKGMTTEQIDNGNYKIFRKVLEHLSIKFSENILKKVLKNYGWVWIWDDMSNRMFKYNKHIIDNIKNQYKHFPEPYMITSVWDKDFINAERKNIEGTNYGFDMGKLFEPKNKSSSSFANEEQIVQLFQYYFGYPDKTRGYDIQNQYKMNGIMPRIERICNNKCRTLQTPIHKTSQLWFLPHDNIATITKALLQLLASKFPYIYNKYVFYIAVDKRGVNIEKNVEYMAKADNIKDEIKKLEAKIMDKENKEYSTYDGLIILAGKRLQLGISLENVDIVSLFTNITASDAIYQMIFRSMTEIDDDNVCDGSSYCSNKKYGFMVDLNPQRTIYTLEYFVDRITSKDDGYKKEDRYNRIADLINIDKDKFISKYDDGENNSKYVKEFFEKLYSSWEANTENIKTIMKEQDIFNDIDAIILHPNFDVRRLYNNEKGSIKKAIITPDDALPMGRKIELKEIYKGQRNKMKGIDEADELRKMWIDIISESISILSFISSYYKLEIECIFNKEKRKDFNYEILKIFDEVRNDKDLKDMFIYFLNNRVIQKGKIADEALFNMVYNIIRLMNVKPAKEDKQSGGHIEINKIIHMRKEKIYNIKEPDKLLEFINANLAPKQTEKKERGEVFTPMKLVNEMLDALPKDVWRNKDLKWLDPASGMGNFPVAVYMRLMDGLKAVIPSEENRRKHILEEMLYMVEFDKANVFMMKKIFCGKNKDGIGTYKLNIFEGSFIEGDGYIRDGIDIYSSTSSTFNNKENNSVIVKVRKFDNRFDIILGNPPFNKDGVGKGGGVFWKYFVDKSLKIVKNDGYILMIHPTGWRKPVSMRASAGDIWNVFKKYNLLFLKITDEKIPNFPKVDYYVLKKSTTQQNTKVINQFEKNPSMTSVLNLYNLPFIPHLISNEVISIINKVLNKNRGGEKFDIKYDQTIKPKKGIRNISGIPHAHYFDINTKKYQEVFDKYKPDYVSISKIIMTYKSGKTSANLYAKYFSKGIGTTNNTMYQLITKKDNINSLITFLNSKLILFILKITQYSSPPHQINEYNILNMFAKPNDAKINTDEDIYNYYKLTINERNLINKIIGDTSKTQKNIKTKHNSI